MKGLYEILTEKKWMVSPDFVHGIRKALEANLNAHAAFEKPEKTCGFVTAVSADGTVYYPEEYQVSEDGQQCLGQWALEYTDEKGNSMQNFPFVSVLSVDGPITRNGGGCSYGSIDHRDMMMKAAKHPLCCGHLFIINTPGGSAWAKNDYEQAINFAHEQGQPVIAFIDGLCASAGMYLASMCDERYYMNPKNEIGCIGVMAAFYTEADGSTNQFTNETYHELYDPESFDKNKAFRDIANDGDSKELVEDLAKLGVEFRDAVKKSCPACTEEHLHGKVFDAEEVEGILVDGQSTFEDTIKRCFALFRQEAEPIKREATVPLASPEGNPEPKKPEGEPEPQKPEGEPEPEPKKPQNSNNNIDMANYPLTKAACGVEELQVSEEGAFMNAPLLDALEQKLDAYEKAEIAAAQAAEAAQKELDEVKDSLAKAQASLKEVEEQLATAQTNAQESANALTAEKEASAKALADAQAEAQKTLDAKVAELAEVQQNLDGAKASLATAEQALADKDAQILALTTNPAQAPSAGATPANNGEGAEQPQFRCNAPQYDPHKSPKENKAAMKAYRESLTK